MWKNEMWNNVFLLGLTFMAFIGTLFSYLIVLKRYSISSNWPLYDYVICRIYLSTKQYTKAMDVLGGLCMKVVSVDFYRLLRQVICLIAAHTPNWYDTYCRSNKPRTTAV